MITNVNNRDRVVLTPDYLGKRFELAGIRARAQEQHVWVMLMEISQKVSFMNHCMSAKTKNL